MNKRNIITLFLFLFIAIPLAVYFYKKQNNDTIKTYGNIEIRTVDLSFQVSGIIDKLLAQEGDYVKKGDLLAVIDDKDYKTNYKMALFKKEAQMAQAKEDLSKYKRNLPLCNDGTVSKQDCTSFLNKKDLSEANYKEANANLEYQKNQLNYTRLFAPQDGIITTRAQEKGARVNINQTVFIMSLENPIWIRTYIKEEDLGKIKYGKKARILTDTTDIKTNKPKEYEGFVGYISPVAEFTPKTVQTEDLRVDLVYRIRVYVKKTDEFLRQGMPVTVIFDLKDEK